MRSILADLQHEVRQLSHSFHKLEGTLNERVSDSRGRHDLIDQKVDTLQTRIELAHTRISAIRHGQRWALGLAIATIVTIIGWVIQWFLKT